MTTRIRRVPRLVYCATEHLHQDLTRAREICAGRFTHAGATRVFEGNPRWCDTGVHPDREWWIERSKFYYGLDLAYAFGMTGEDIFRRTWERLVQSWIDQVPVWFGTTDAIGRRLQNWIYAWTMFGNALAWFSAEFEASLTRSVAAQAAFLRAHLTPERNHRTLELYALLIVALALPETDRRGERARFAWSELQRNLLSDVRPDGVHREHSTHYHMVALRTFLAARKNATLFGLPVAEGYDQRLARACEFAMHCQRPDGSIPALSDSDVADYRESLALAAELLDRPDFLYVATNGREGKAPAATAGDFPEGGYFIRRSAWRELNDRSQAHRHLIFDCGALGDGGHGHYDVLNIEAFSARPLIVDPGRFTYAEGTPNWRQWFKGTKAHNTVSVDGLDQTEYRVGKAKTQPATGRLITRVTTPSLDVLGGEARSARYDAVHRRHVFFVHDEYWIVADELTAATAHEYDLRYHLAPEAWQRTVVDGRTVSAPGVNLLFSDGAIALEDGWVSREYGIKAPAPVVSVRRHDVAARFVTAIVPTGDVASPHGPLVARAIRDGLHVVVLRRVDGCIDRLMWQERADGLPEGGSVVARAVWTRTSPDGELVASAACGRAS